jgi:signal transduction histidine kinase
MAALRGPLTEPARQVSLLRLLLTALALAVLTFGTEHRQETLAPETFDNARWLLLGVGVVAGMLAALVHWTRHRWQLILHLIFDLLWVGIFIYLTGGVASPAVLLLFAVVLIANLALPGVALFVMPALASLVMAGCASLYLAHASPFPKEFLTDYPALDDTNRILGNLAVQIGGFFVVDLLAQLLTRRLREQQLFTEQLLDQLGEGVIAIDRHGMLIYLNGEAERLLHLPAQSRGLPAVTALAGKHVAVVRELALDPDLPQLRRLPGPNGRHLVVRATRLQGRNGAMVGRTILIADETRLRLLEQNAQRSEHLSALGEMAAGIAHEVRNPLTSLRGCAQELEEMHRSSGNPDATALASILITESDRLARIVSDFLALSRMRAPQREPLDLEALLEELKHLTRLRRDVPDDVAVVVTLADDTPSVLADADQIRQVLQNLVNNSLDAMRTIEQPRVSVSAERASDDNPLGMPAVVIEVSDNGCGIPVELQQRVFTPFFSTKPQGTGLGLSLVNRIVREHEGILELGSTLGTGTCITIYLPAHSQTRAYSRALGK